MATRKGKPEPVTAIVIGAGGRGKNYAYYSVDCPDKLKIVSVCDPNDFRRNRFARHYKISEDFIFTDWKPCVERRKFADCVFICTPDQLHKDPAIAFAKKGYHILLEKPMAVTEADCREIVETCKKHGVMLAVCHVLRYTLQAQKIKQLIESGTIGDVVNIQLLEPPPNAGSRCLDCAVEKTCPYSAKRIYLDSGRTGWPVSVITDVPDIESITEALKTGPYGKCVYDCDNDVCDNQVVNLQFEDGSTASFTMIAFTKQICERQVKVFGTLGELNCDFSYMRVTHHNFVTGQRFEYDLTKESEGLEKTSLRGHGGADFFAMEAFVSAIQGGDPSKILTGPEESLASHILCFRAEQARLENRVVTLT